MLVAEVDVVKPHLWENVPPAPVVPVVGMTVEIGLVPMKTVVSEAKTDAAIVHQNYVHENAY